mgnify:FL=1
MKKHILSTLCAAFLLLPLLVSVPMPAHAAVSKVFSSPPEGSDFGDWVVVTGPGFDGACLSYMLENIPIKAERLQIAFPSSPEMIEFHQGKIIRYTGLIYGPSPVNLKNIRKVTFTPERQPKTMGGDKDKAIAVYSLNTDMGDEALDIEALTLWLNGKKCKLDYSAREKEYILRCK